jgi:hypothetical protein
VNFLELVKVGKSARILHRSKNPQEKPTGKFSYIKTDRKNSTGKFDFGRNQQENPQGSKDGKNLAGKIPQLYLQYTHNPQENFKKIACGGPSRKRFATTKLSESF